MASNDDFSASTSVLMQPVAKDSSTFLCAFSPKGDLFAFLSFAVDRPSVSIYDTTTGQSFAQCIVDAARVTTLSWTYMEIMSDASTADNDLALKQKQRKQPLEGGSKVEAEVEPAEVVVLGLSNGSLLVYSPSHRRVARTLSYPSSTASILALDVAPSTTSPNAAQFWTSGADGYIRVWDAHTGEHLSSTRADDRVPGTSLSILPRVPSSDDEEVSFLLAHQNIRMLATRSAETPGPKPKVQSTFTGHATSILSLQWQPASSEGVLPTRFASLAEADRHVYLWDVPEPSFAEGELVASVQLDSDAKHMTFSQTPSNPVLLVLSVSGRLAIFAPSADLATAPPTKKSKQKAPRLMARTTISIPQIIAPVKIVAASFVRDEQGRLRVALLAGGVKPVFDVVDFLDASGGYIPEVDVLYNESWASLAEDGESSSGAPTVFYTAVSPESDSLVYLSALPADQDIRHSAKLIKLTLKSIITSQRMRAEFHSGLQEIYLEHLDNNHDVAVWYAVNWVDWLADSRTPLQVHLDCRLKGNELGWMTRVKGPGRQFSILWDLVLAASRASVPPPSLPPSSPLFNFLSALCAPCPFAVPLPRIYFKFLLAAVTIHETFHLVNCHVFPDFGTPKTENLPHGEGGTAIEMQLFKGRIITEWYAGHEGDFSYLCGLYVLTSDGHVAITEEDLGVFMAELLDGRATKFSWKMVKRATYPTAEQGKVRTFAFKGKPIPKKTAWRQPVHRIFPGKVRKSMLEGCHD